MNRVMVPMEAARAAPIRVLAAGGAHRIAATEGAIRLLKPTALVMGGGSPRIGRRETPVTARPEKPIRRAIWL